MDPAPTVPASNPRRLGDRVRDALRLGHCSPRTERACLHWIRRFFTFGGRRDPALLGAAEGTAFLTDLALTHRVAAL